MKQFHVLYNCMHCVCECVCVLCVHVQICMFMCIAKYALVGLQRHTSMHT